jgi:hypothetical protein
MAKAVVSCADNFSKNKKPRQIKMSIVASGGGGGPTKRDAIYPPRRILFSLPVPTEEKVGKKKREIVSKK